MATLRQIIKDSFRENNLLAVNVEPSDAQQNEALTVFQDMVNDWFGFLQGEFLQDWPAPPVMTSPVAARFPLLPATDQLTSDQWPYPPANVRLLTANTTPNTIYLPNVPEAGAAFSLVNVSQDFVTNPLTLDANGRLISGNPTLTVNVAQTAPRRWMYREDTATWTELTNLTLDGLPPYPTDLDSFNKVALAIRLSPRYGVTVDSVTAGVYKSGLANMIARYKQKGPTPINYDAIGFNSAQSYQWSARFWQGE